MKTLELEEMNMLKSLKHNRTCVFSKLTENGFHLVPPERGQSTQCISRHGNKGFQHAAAHAAGLGNGLCRHRGMEVTPSSLSLICTSGKEFRVYPNEVTM